MTVKSFIFNPFSENTYLLYDETLECVIIDPGCSNLAEQNELLDFIEENRLKPVALVNTHCHIDHVLGNAFIHEHFGLELQAHAGEKIVLDMQPQISNMYGIPYTPSPDISIFLDEETGFSFGETTMQVLYTPGHSPASISFYHAASNQLIAGDVLFYNSIGRTDLPGGDYDTLIASIKNKLLSLPEETIVYNGHGMKTKIGFEKKTNPFLQ